MPSIRRTVGCVLGCLLVPVGALAIPWLVFESGLYPPGYTDPTFTYGSSPDARYTVIHEQRLGFLDAFERIWIAPAGETRRERWHPIGPEVDGCYWHEWTSNSDLLLTNQGWPEGDYGPDGFQVERWRDVRIETRRRAVARFVDSPDELHCVSMWTYRDSKGSRTSARLDTTWMHERPGSIDLVEEGPWDLEAAWISKDRLEVRVLADPGAVSRERPTLSWTDVEISFVSGTRSR